MLQVPWLASWHAAAPGNGIPRSKAQLGEPFPAAVCTGPRGAKNIVSCEQKMSELFWFPLSFFFFVLFFLKATFSIPLCRLAGYLLTWSRKTHGKEPFDTAGTR